MADVRLHHYLFAHRQLPGTLFSAPARTMQLLRDEPDRFLGVLWANTGERVPDRDRLPFGGLGTRYQADAVPGIDLAVVTMPEPVAETEAWFVALAAAPVSVDGAVDPARCFTLELGWSVMDDRPYPVLGGWDAENRHLNFGRGPEPTLEAFTVEVVDRLAPRGDAPP